MLICIHTWSAQNCAESGPRCSSPIPTPLLPQFPRTALPPPRLKPQPELVESPHPSSSPPLRFISRLVVGSTHVLPRRRTSRDCLSLRSRSVVRACSPFCLKHLISPAWHLPVAREPEQALCYKLRDSLSSLSRIIRQNLPRLRLPVVTTTGRTGTGADLATTTLSKRTFGIESVLSWGTKEGESADGTTGARWRTTTGTGRAGIRFAAAGATTTTLFTL